VLHSGYMPTLPWQAWRLACGSMCLPCLYSEAWEKKSVGGEGANLVTDGIMEGLYHLVLA
jgi:hypothetical protein